MRKTYLAKMKHHHGSILISVIAFMTIGTLILSGFVGWSIMSVRVARHTEQREQALQIAEAGVDYYRWHMAHDASDYQDGTATTGPYVHPFYDKNGIQIGTFSLDVTTPLIGSTLVTITSTGTLSVDPSIHRTIQTKLGKPSFAKFAVLSNSDMSIGADIQGPMHSNGGILFNSGSIAHNVVTSAKTTFSIYGSTEWGVSGPGDPNPPTAFTPVNGVFLAGRQVGVPAVSFANLSVDFLQLKTDAQAGGLYYADSGALGYHIVLKTNDTFDLYRVTSFASGGSSCKVYEWWTYPNCPLVSNGTWSIGAQNLLFSNVSFPANGIIFFGDDVWVDGQINSARITIAAATLPDVGTRRNIIVNNNLLYTNYDGQDVVGLIAQDNFWVGLMSANNLRVDAAIITQNGRVSRYAYNNSCTNRVRSTITLYGMFATNQRYAYGNLGSGCSNPTSLPLTGYQTDRTYIYDPNLLYSPPPSFPLTTDSYQTISWKEI